MKGFTHQQNHELSRGEKLKHYLRLHQSKVDTYLPLKEKQAQYELRISEIQKSVGEKLQETKEMTVQKKKIKTKLGIFYESVCGVSLAYLMAKNNLEMAANFKVTKRTFTHMSDGNVIGRARQLNKWIEDELIPQPDFAPYGITPATISQSINLINRFDWYLGEVKAINARKSAVGKSIEAQTKQLKDDVEMIELLMHHFRISSPEFFRGFLSVKNLDNLGIRHNVIKGKVTISGKPAGNIKITCSVPNKSADTDLLGLYTFPRIRAGSREFFCSPPGLPPQRKIIRIIRGIATEINWEF